MGEYIAYIAANLTYSCCEWCWDFPCLCMSFRYDIQACITALEMGY